MLLIVDVSTFYRVKVFAFTNTFTCFSPSVLSLKSAETMRIFREQGKGEGCKDGSRAQDAYSKGWQSRGPG